MEIRQLRYVVTLAEELHFGRAADREHIVQSALSQQVRRLEREIGVTLFDRNTHQVQTTDAGQAFVVEARRILMHLDRAAELARRATSSHQVVRLGFTEAGYEQVPALIESVIEEHPDLEVHQSSLSGPQQFDLLQRGRLDLGIGSARFAPDEVACEELAHVTFGVLVSSTHPWAVRHSVTVADLQHIILLLGVAEHAPEYNAFVREFCLLRGFEPRVHPGGVDSARAAADLVVRQGLAFCGPRSLWPRSPELHWVALADPVVHYPQALLWREDDRSAVVRTFVRHARRLDRSRAAAAG